ncbi:hypothetical protein B0H19DRAFT_1156114 [Mycena capillaripes]|nr:hypothetical protein B0H19DRAFT_1156114 [Mycena capillaripes]
MHQWLRLENLALLPVSFRRFASAAANGSMEDFMRLTALLRKTEYSQIFTHCLPVFYANLDPAKIPTGEDVITLATTRALLALSALRKITAAEKPAWPDLWCRIWPWILFLHTYRDYFPGALSPREPRQDLLFFIDCFRHDPETNALIGRTPGVRSLAMDAWWSLLNTKTPVDDPGFDHLCGLMYNIQADDDENLTEILEGVGGPSRLAGLILISISIFIPTTTITERNLVLLKALLVFLRSVVPEREDENEGIRASVSAALVETRVVASLTVVSWMIGEAHPHHDSTAGILLDCCIILRGLLVWRRAVRNSLNAGLFRTIIYCATLTGGDSSGLTSLRELLTRTLPAATVYRTVLVELDAQFRNVALMARAEAPEFQNTEFYQPWSYFVSLALGRIALVNEMDSYNHKACDNMECGIINKRTDFKRCSHCRRVYYCSVDCQKNDWRSGGHREMCQSVRAFGFTNEPAARTRSFMRALLHKDLMERRYHELPLLLDPDHLSYLQHNVRSAPSNPPVTVLDYTQGYPRMFIDAANAQQADDENHQVHWDEHIARCMRSHGRMELHLMIVKDGPGSWPTGRRVMLPQRSDRPSLHDGLLQVFREHEENDVQPKVRELLEANESSAIVKIH